MKFTSSDIAEIRRALVAANKAGIESFVIHEGQVRGLNIAQNSVIFSKINLTLDENIQIGIAKISVLANRLTLFGEDVVIDGEVNDAQKMRRLTIKGKSGKVDYRCTDARLITYPKTNSDEPFAVVTLSKAEIALVSKGAKLMASETITVQVRRDGTVHVECTDSNNDRFELDLQTKAEFVDEENAFVHQYDAGSKGTLIDVMEYLAKDSETVTLVFTRSGNVGIKLLGFDMIAVPRIVTGG